MLLRWEEMIISWRFIMRVLKLGKMHYLKAILI